MAKDYYDILGISKTASRKDIETILAQNKKSEM